MRWKMIGSDPQATMTLEVHATDPLKPGVFNDVCDVATEGIYVLDLDRRVVYWNRAAERISGFDPRYVLGRRCADRMLRHCDATGQILCSIACPMLAVMTDGASRTSDVFLLHKDGRRVPVHVRGEAIRHDGKIVGSVEFFQDMTQPLTMLEELRAASMREKIDSLTGVGNRRLIEGALETLCAPGVPPTGVIMLDIDNFKQVNDRHGHGVGDRVVREVALTIAGELRSSDVVARWGGDEFVVLAPNVDIQVVGGLADRIRALVGAVRIPCDDDELAPAISAGATVTRAGDTPGSVIERADRLMYLSKEHGRNQVTIG